MFLLYSLPFLSFLFVLSCCSARCPAPTENKGARLCVRTRCAWGGQRRGCLNRDLLITSSSVYKRRFKTTQGLVTETGVGSFPGGGGSKRGGIWWETSTRDETATQTCPWGIYTGTPHRQMAHGSEVQGQRLSRRDILVVCEGWY